METATGVKITDKLIYEDLETLLNLARGEKDEQTTSLMLLEKEHGDLLIKMKEIQLDIEQFRTLILQKTRNINETKLKIKNRQQINDHLQDHTSKRINKLSSNTQDIQMLLVDYKSIVNEIQNLLKLIFHSQTQIETHHKSTLIYQTKLEKYKQDLILVIRNRTDYDEQILNLEKIIHQQNQNFKQLKSQQMQTVENRQQLYQSVYNLENKRNLLLNNQQQLLDMIKQATLKRNLLEKEILHSNHAIQALQYPYRKLINDRSKQQNITKHLQKTS